MSKTILLADDSVTIQKVIELTFMDEDYEVVSASNGEQALERLDEVTPDVVIADVHMPGASGFDVAKRAKQLHPHVPVLLLVGTFEPFDEGDYEASGADSYLKKPFDSQELLQRVSSLLESAPAAAPASAPPAAPPFDAEDELVVEEEPGWGADDPLPRPEPEPAAAPAVYASAPTESLLPPIRPTEEPEEEPFRLEEEESPDEEPPAGSAWGESAEVRDDDASADDLGTRAIPSFGGRESVQPAAPSSAGGDPGGDPFPELSTTPRAAAPRDRDDDLFGLDEGDGSTEVQPPPDLLQAESGRPGDSPYSVTTPPPDDEPRVVGEPPQVESAAESDEEADAERPVRVPPAPPAAAPGAAGTAASSAPASTAATGSLSDEDVDRIARRVAELVSAEVLREVAWEVVPDLAEVVIKDRLRELEGQVEEN